MTNCRAIAWNWCNTPNPLVQASAEGVARHPAWRVQWRNLRYFNDADTEPSADLALLCGWRTIRRDAALRHMAHGTPVLIHDLGYLNRFGAHYGSETHHYQIGLNGLCWLPPADACDGSRFEKLGMKLKTCRRKPGEDILVLGQVPEDAQHDMPAAELLAWYGQAIAAMKAAGCTRRIVWRPHPRIGPDMALPEADEQQDSQAVPLAEALKTAYACLTFNSTAGTEALLDAVPVICSPAAMYADYAETDPAAVDQPRTGDREEYFRRLAYAQWTAPECRAGEAFEFLEPFARKSRELLLHT